MVGGTAGAMTLDFTKCRLKPFQHQREDVEWLFQNPYAFIASEMRTGKTKIIIDTAQFLFEANIIDRVVVVTPAPVRHVWSHQEIGELRKHLWASIHATVTDYHSRTRTWVHGPPVEKTEAKRSLDFFVTNFEFLRSRSRVEYLKLVCGHRTWFVVDESSFVKNHAAEQTKACVILRNACRRVTLLNGTPLFHSPLDLFSQGNLILGKILDCKYVSQFKARYAIQKPVLVLGGEELKDRWGRTVQKIDKWTNLDDLERRFKPYTIRRLQADCLDLPPKLDPVNLTAMLEPATWRTYKEMRDELVVWLRSDKVVTAATAAVRVLRLSQITGGFLGKPEDANVGAPAFVEKTLFESLDLGGFYGKDTDSGGSDSTVYGEDSGLFEAGAASRPTASVEGDLQDSVRVDGSDVSNDTPSLGKAEGTELRETEGFVEVGREKLDVLLWFIEHRLEADPNLHIVVWSRFRAEVIRAEREVRKKFPQFQTALIMGLQKKADRVRALSLLHPTTSPKGPVFVAGIEGTGSFGLNMAAAHTCVTLSSGYSPGKTAQTLDRLYGPEQTEPIAYFNIMAVGPQGQKTIDFDILSARSSGEEIALRTAAAWVKVLDEE